MSLTESLVLRVAALEAILLALGWIFLFGHGARRRMVRSGERRRGEAREGLIAGVVRGSLDPESRDRMRALPPEARRHVFEEVASNLRGEEREWLSARAGELGLVEAGRRLCESRFWWRRLEGARLLTLVGGAGDRVLRLADDPHPLVRSQVAEWCGEHPSEAAARTLTGMLGDPDQASRFAVQDALVRLGGIAVKPLAEALREVRDEREALAALVVARALGDRRLASALLRFGGHDDPRIRAAALRALGRAGGEEAVERLVAGLGDPAPPVREAAAIALGDAGHWQAAAGLARRLTDPAWRVRHAAGGALKKVGPPGRLMLRRSLASDNPFAADMARHVLDLAAVEERGP